MSALAALHLDTTLGPIVLALHADVAPLTVAHISRLVQDGLYNGVSWYRSDFVIQTGLHGSGRANPHPALTCNESTVAGARPNLAGTLAVAHHDVPDCGNSEFFINLQDNMHLNAPLYGGYCVFASVAPGGTADASWRTIRAIASAVNAGGPKPVLRKASLV